MDGFGAYPDTLVASSNLVATSLDRADEAAFVSIDASGFSLETVLTLSRKILDGLRFEGGP